MNRKNLGLTLLAVGFLYVIIFSSLATPNLLHTLRTHTLEEVQNTIWAMDTRDRDPVV
jgi:hypothetical protein